MKLSVFNHCIEAPNHIKDSWPTGGVLLPALRYKLGDLGREITWERYPAAQGHLLGVLLGFIPSLLAQELRNTM